MNIARLMMLAAAGGGNKVAELFSTDLYTGNSTARTITNGINLSSEGGLVWVKNRTQAQQHYLFDTQRGAGSVLQLPATSAETFGAQTITSFNSAGFSFGTASQGNLGGDNYVAWTFRQAPKFFDVVTYTGTGVARSIAHNLGAVPGMMIVKVRDSGANWAVYHRSNTAAPATDFLELNTNVATFDDIERWNDTEPTSTLFSVGASGATNFASNTYVAYLFAHDPSPTGVIQCGAYTGNGSATGPVVNLGWDPQWLMIKRSDGAGDWKIFDKKREVPAGGGDKLLAANSSGTETGIGNFLDTGPSGFSLKSNDEELNANGSNYIYMAIRAEGA